MDQSELLSGVRLLAGAILSGLAVSCVGAPPPSIKSQNAEQLVPAIKEGVQAHDRHIIPYLVADLDSDDAAVRMYSIDGLKRLTGQDMGYVYYDDQDQRKPAVGRWQKWLSEQQQ